MDLFPIRETIRDLAPAFVRRWVRATRIRLDALGNARRSTEEIFTHIYLKNRWGGEKSELFSGSGSRGSMAEISARIAADIIAERNARTVVDVGCGDFFVSSRVLQLLAQQGRRVTYVGIDVVETVIERNRARFGVPGTIGFLKCNAVSETLPPGDVVILRQVCQHLSNAEIEALLRNTDGYVCAVMFEHHPAANLVTTWNADKPTGADIRALRGSGIRPDLPPFDRSFRLIGRIPVEHTLTSRTIDPTNQECLAVFYRGPRLNSPQSFMHDFP